MWPSLWQPSLEPPCRQLGAMAEDLDAGLVKDDLAADLLGRLGAGSSFHNALQSVAAEHGREVHRMELEMAELRELVTHLQGMSLAQEVKSMSVEVSALDGSPLKVETVLADGRKFMTVEPPELAEERDGSPLTVEAVLAADGSQLATPEAFVSEGFNGNDSAGEPGDSDLSQNGRASACSIQARGAAGDQGGKSAAKGIGDDQREDDPWPDGRASKRVSDSDPFQRALPPQRRGYRPPPPVEPTLSYGHQRSSAGTGSMDLGPQRSSAGSPCASAALKTQSEREDSPFMMAATTTGDDHDTAKAGGVGHRGSEKSAKARTSRAWAFAQRGKTGTLKTSQLSNDVQRFAVFSRARTATMLTTQSHQSWAWKMRGSESTDQSRISRRLAMEQAEFETQAQRRWREKRQAYEKRSQSMYENWQSFRRNGSCTMRYIVHHWSFDCFCGLMICANAVLIGLSTQHIARNAGVDKQEYEVSGLFCNAFFLVELLMRVYVDRLKFFTSQGWRWNLFDTLLVVLSGVDAVIQYGFVEYDSDASSVAQRMKTIKMLRIARVCRVFRFFSELRLLALMILDCFKSLAWALCMLGIIMYCFAILFTQDVAVHLARLKDSSSPPDPVLANHFGDLFATLSSLFHSILNGISWYTLTQALKYNPAMTALFFFYTSFVLVAVLNIITGVFVNEAVQTTLSQREFLIEKQMVQKQRWCREMKDLFQSLDTDGNGGMSLEEIQECLFDPRVESYFQALGLEPHDAEQLFFHLDRDLSGEVSLDEFLQGCLRLKGEARSIEVYSVMHELKTLTSRFDDLEVMLRKAAAAAAPDQEASPRPRTAHRRSATGLSKHNGGGSRKALPEPFEEEVMFPEPVQEDETPPPRPARAADGMRINGRAIGKTLDDKPLAV